MICTMRNWEKQPPSSRSSSRLRTTKHSNAAALEQPPVQTSPKQKDTTTSEPELLFTPIAEYHISSRDDSPGRRSLSRPKVSPANQPWVDPVQYSLPFSEIWTVNATTVHNNHRLNITTRSMGIFEFDHLTKNAFDILLAFLQSCICADRILIGCDESTTTANNMYHETPRSTSSVTSCFDIDALQAQQLNKRAELETWPEKLSRRVGHVVNSLSELSSSFCDAACCRDAPSWLSDNPNHQHDSHPRRDNTPEKSYRFHELEIDNNTTDTPRPKNNHHERKQQDDPIRNLPSGLSVEESEPEWDAAK